MNQMGVCGHGKIAAELGISKRRLYTWRDHFRKLVKAALAATSKERALERRTSG